MLHHEQYGEGSPLVILHGLYGAGENWRSTAGKLTGWQVYAPDLPSHGRSDSLPAWDHEKAAREILRWADRQGLQSFPLVGHSLGGKVAMAISQIAPERVERLVVADIAPVAYPPHHQHIFEALASIDLQALNNRRHADEQLEKGGVKMKMVRQFLLKSLYRDGEHFAWRFDVEGLKTHQRALAKAPEKRLDYQRPVSLIYGEQSTYVDLEGMNAMKQFYPQCDFQCVANAGHWLHVEQPDAFVSTLEQALS